MGKQEINFGMITVYFGDGITFLEAGDKLSDDITIVDKPTAEVQYINGMLSFQDAKIARFWGEELCNTMGAYLIPQLYNGEIIGLEKAIKNYLSELK